MLKPAVHREAGLKLLTQPPRTAASPIACPSTIPAAHRRRRSSSSVITQARLRTLLLLTLPPFLRRHPLQASIFLPGELLYFRLPTSPSPCPVPRNYGQISALIAIGLLGSIVKSFAYLKRTRPFFTRSAQTDQVLNNPTLCISYRPPAFSSASQLRHTRTQPNNCTRRSNKFTPQ